MLGADREVTGEDRRPVFVAPLSAEVRVRTGLALFRAMLSGVSLLGGDLVSADRLSSIVSCSLPSLGGLTPLVVVGLLAERPCPGLNDSLFDDGLVVGGTAVPADLDAGGPDIDCLEGLCERVGAAGGPIDVRLLKLGRARLCMTGGRPAAPGVVVRGVEAPDEAEDPTCLVGDLVGDCQGIRAKILQYS